MVESQRSSNKEQGDSGEDDFICVMPNVVKGFHKNNRVRDCFTRGGGGWRRVSGSWRNHGSWCVARKSNLSATPPLKQSLSNWYQRLAQPHTAHFLQVNYSFGNQNSLPRYLSPGMPAGICGCGKRRRAIFLQRFWRPIRSSLCHRQGIGIAKESQQEYFVAGSCATIGSRDLRYLMLDRIGPSHGAENMTMCAQYIYANHQPWDSKSNLSFTNFTQPAELRLYNFRYLINSIHDWVCF